MPALRALPCQSERVCLSCLSKICSESLLTRDGCGQATGVIDAAFDSKDSLEAGVGAVVETPWLGITYSVEPEVDARKWCAYRIIFKLINDDFNDNNDDVGRCAREPRPSAACLELWAGEGGPRYDALPPLSESPHRAAAPKL